MDHDPRGEVSDGTQSIERAISVLRMLATRGRFGWGLTELADASGLKKATAHRILARLERERLVHRGGMGDRYFLGAMLGELSLSIPGFQRLAQEAQEFTVELGRRLALLTVVVLRSGDHFVVISRSASSRMRAEINQVGARRPLISAAGGTAMLALLDEAEQTHILHANRMQMSQQGRTRIEDCLSMWERSRALGHGANFGDVAPGVNAVAVAAVNRLGAPFASITLAGPEGQLPVKRCHEVVETLRRETVRLSQLASHVHPDLYDCEEATV